MNVATASKRFGVNEAWLRDGIGNGSNFLVVVGVNGQEEYWPRYYQTGQLVPGKGDKLGGMKYAHTVVNLSGISID